MSYVRRSVGETKRPATFVTGLGRDNSDPIAPGQRPGIVGLITTGKVVNPVTPLKTGVMDRRT